MSTAAVECARQPIDCPDQMLVEAVWTYRAYLFDQAGDRWTSLPSWFVTAAEPYYPGVDLTRVRYVEGVETVHGKHITWGEHIFFVTPMGVGNYLDVHLMVHELEHVRQYQEAEGEQPFLSRYLTTVCTPLLRPDPSTSMASWNWSGPPKLQPMGLRR
jgi:hypothetical protein